MKRLLAAVFISAIIFTSEANEYTSLKDREKELDGKISKLQENINNGGFGHFFTTSWYERDKEKEDLIRLESERKETKNRISEIERKTVVTLTRVELQNVPREFDQTSLTNADLWVYLRSDGPEKPFIDQPDITSYVTVQLRCEVVLRWNDSIEIKDDDVTEREDMGTVHTDDIIVHALRNDHDKGVFEKKMPTKWYKTFTARFYYKKK